MKVVIKFIAIGCSALLLSACATSGSTGKPGEASNEAAKKNFELGLAYIQQGQMDAAQSKFAKAISFDPKYYPAYNALGALYEEKQAYALALKSYARAAVSKDYYLARLNYARLLCSNPPQGVASIKEALAIYKDIEKRVGGKNRAAALTGAGVCFSRVKQFPAAELSFTQALEASPGYPQALTELANIRQLQGKVAAPSPNSSIPTPFSGADLRVQ